MIKEQRDGYVVKVKNTGRHDAKMPLFCPHELCRRITSTLDDPYIKEYGVCKNCYVMYIDERKTPAIDVAKYAQRFKDRGF